MSSRRRAGAVVASAVVLALVAGLVDAGTAGSEETTDTETTTTIDAGDTARSDGLRVEPSLGNPVVATVTTPVDGPITFDKLASDEITAVDGYEAITAIDITAPDATANDPLRMTFDVDISTLPSGVPTSAMVPLRDGEPVATCISTVIASPDPCLLSRVVETDVLHLSVLTSAASTWTMARALVERVAPDTTSTTATDVGAIAIAASRHAFPPQSADAVVLARADDFADALAGAPLAARRNAALLLTSSDALDDATLDEITRVLPSNGTVYILGGTGAVSTAVSDRLRSWGFLVLRYGGADRYATAVTIAEDALDSPDVVVETTGADFADALAAGAIARHVDGAVLLTAGPEQSAATAAYLHDHRPRRYAVGGPSATADPEATAFAGQDRLETAVLAARHFFTSPRFLTLASGFTYTDAVTAAAYAASEDTPLLLLPASGDLPVPVQIYLRELGETRPSAVLYGDTTSVGADVLTAVAASLAE